MPSSRSQARALPAPGHVRPGRSLSLSPSISDEEDDMPAELPSPQTGLLYRVSGLTDPETRASVQDVLNDADPPEMYMSQCRLHKGVYAIEIKEVVSRTVRIGVPGGRYAAPVCEACVGGVSRDPVVCRHVVWVMDQVSKQAQGLLGWNPDAALTMSSAGYAAEMGSPYELIAEYRLDLLAARLDCRVAPPAGESRARIDHLRIEKIRKMLTWLTGSPPPHSGTLGEGSLLLGGAEGGGIARSGDLAETLFRMLYSDDAFYGYFCRQMEALERASDRFNRLGRLADHVFAIFDRSVHHTPPGPPESPVDVAWAARHIDAIVREIGTMIQRLDPADLGPYEREAAAETLLHILRQVVTKYSQARDGASLYGALIGNPVDRNFVIGQLAGLCPVAVLLADELEALYHRCCEMGAPDTYLARFYAVVDKVRNARG